MHSSADLRTIFVGIKPVRSKLCPRALCVPSKAQGPFFREWGSGTTTSTTTIETRLPPCGIWVSNEAGGARGGAWDAAHSPPAPSPAGCNCGALSSAPAPASAGTYCGWSLARPRRRRRSLTHHFSFIPSCLSPSAGVIRMGTRARAGARGWYEKVLCLLEPAAASCCGVCTACARRPAPGMNRERRLVWRWVVVVVVLLHPIHQMIDGHLGRECASDSIPLLGHFPSEITGKSLFALVHPEDAQRVRDAHQQLHATGGVQIVRTPALRLAAYAGHAVTVDAEWAAFVNPWTSTVEMVVGRHTFVADGHNATAQQHQQYHHQHQQQKPINNVPTGKNVLLQSADESAADTAFLQELFMKHVPAAQPSAPTPNAVVAVCQNEMPKMAVMVKQEEPEVEMDQQQHHQQQQLKLKANNNMNNNGTTTGNNELSNGTGQVYLSYNQINCLENVHRLLKSQSSNGSAADGEPCGGGAGKMPADSAPPSQPTPPSQIVAPSASPPLATTAAVAATTPSGGGAGTALTRELLQLHDQRWEERCRAHWRRRLSQQTMTVAAASPRCHQTQQKQKRPLSQEQPGNFASRSPPAVADWHHHPQQHHHHVAKLARCRSEQRRSAWQMPAAQQEDEPSPLHAVPPSAAAAVVVHNEQPPCGGALPPAELIALIAAVLQNVPPPSPPAEIAKIGIVAAPLIMNDSNGTPLGLHPQLLDQLLQAAASARNTLNARLLKQDSNNNNQHNSSTSCSNNI
ncbi:hypothetical protein niasHS_006344 [Heterodera schachtii]|uniref:PAS domain-containing protein n=1 Tax=Heterodera schachtii TaxID=97005 RepID=A0ABD2JWN5_HETSC